jgi:predicted dehydrogenase
MDQSGQSKLILPTRRTIMAATSLAAGAAVVSQLAPSAYAQGNDTLKAALIGCGGRGTGAANDALNTSHPIKLVAAADVFQDRIDSAMTELTAMHKDKIDVPAERRFVGFDAFKKAIDAGVDIVIMATPPGWRPQHFEYAVQQNKHVFMEKPVAVDAPGVRRVIAASQEAKKKNLKVGVGLQRHHDPLYQQTIAQVRDGAIGQPVFMRAYWNGGGIWTRPRQPGMSEMQYQMANWYYFNWLCGDHIVEQHIHNIDVINWIKDAYPVSAQGVGGRQVRTGKEFGQIYDHHMIEFTYADGSTMLSQCRHIAKTWSSVSEHVHGTNGYANISGGLVEPKGGTKWRFRGEKPNPYRVEHEVLWDAVRNNKDHNEGEAGALATQTGIMGRMASYSGKMIRWDQALASERVEAPGQDNYTWDSTPPVTPDADGNYPVPMPGDYDPFKPMA